MKYLPEDINKNSFNNNCNKEASIYTQINLNTNKYSINLLYFFIKKWKFQTFLTQFTVTSGRQNILGQLSGF